MAFDGKERRKHPRIGGKFVVSYRVKKDDEDSDISQTRNISLGGMVLTTNKQFPSGTVLELNIRLPFFTDTLTLNAIVQESKEVVNDLIYDTRIKFCDVDKETENTIKDTIDYYIKVRA